jgi:CRP/FNR family transcriptional regulator, cyclic AMP receptor protein
MSNESLVAPLLRVRLFQGLSPRQLGDIARRAERIMYRTGALITEEGDAADAAVLIVSGETERIGAGLREPVAPGSLIGELAMLIEHTYGSTVVARGPVKALKITRSMMHDLMLRDQALAEHMVERVSSRLSGLLGEMKSVDAGLEQQQQRLDRGIAAISNNAVTPPDAYIPSAATH